MSWKKQNRVKRWLAYLLVFCMTFSCLEGVFVGTTSRAQAEGLTLTDNGDQLLGVVEGGHFKVSIYTWDDLALVATNDDSMVIEREKIPEDTKLLVRFSDIILTDDVQDYTVYSMNLPEQLVPTLTNEEGNLDEDWMELESASFVKSYGKINADEDGYQFQIYFVNTATQKDIQASFQYGATIAESAPEDGSVDSDFGMGNLSFDVEVSNKDFTFQKSAVWEGTESYTTSDQAAGNIIYTLTITNNRADADTVGVTASMTEQLSASQSFYYSQYPVVNPNTDIYGLTVSIDDAEPVTPQQIGYAANGQSVRMVGIVNGGSVIAISPVATERHDLSSAPVMYFDRFQMDLTDVQFHTLTITFGTEICYGEDQISSGSSSVLYTSKTVFQEGETAYPDITATAVKSMTAPAVSNMKAQMYDNVTDAAAGTNEIASSGMDARYAEVMKYTADISAGGDEWVELTEVPLALSSGYSLGIGG
jgi:hypothetical protein